MNCPNCGSEIFANQQYCRSCGADLVEDRPSAFRPQIGALLILLLIFGGLLTAMAGKLWSVKWVTFTGVFIMIGGMFLVAAYGLLRQSRPRSKKRKPFAPPEPLLRADPTNKLLPIGDNDFVPSVVEPTTDLLKNPVASRSISDE
jgi:hypothetical protein